MKAIRVVALWLVIGACGGGGGGGGGQSEAPPPPPPNATFELSGAAQVNESDNPLVEISLVLDRPARETISAPLTITGTATRDYDYAASGKNLSVAPGETSASIEIDIYRDFEAEGDETITLELGTLTGDAVFTGSRLLSLEIVDGKGPVALKSLEEFEPDREDISLFPAYYEVTENSVDFGIAVWNFSERTTRLGVDYSTDIDFAENVESLGQIDVEAVEFDLDPFAFPFIPHGFSIPLDGLRTDTAYYIRAYLDEPPASFAELEADGNASYLGFATDANGKVRTRCQVSERVPDPSGDDPLFSEQWHLVNTGQSAFSDSGGVSGADLDMRQAIDDGASGTGVKLAIIDTGLEICHPDLAANIVQGESYNFAFANMPGATEDDPFNHDVMGDHGTSVAGVAGASAANGLGGRGVAAKVGLIGYNVGFSVSEENESDMLKALGSSESMPNSASVDIFNMSWGTAVPSGNSSEDFVRLFKHGTSTLRGGLGAVYIKAAGNAFEECLHSHPLNREVGCLGSNTDPDQNLPYTVSIGGFNASDRKSSYSSAGANLWVVAPSGEEGQDAPAIITTDQQGAAIGYNLDPRNQLTVDHALNPDGDYVSAFGGTSSAAPATAGVVALLLEAEPALSWRDVKHLLAVSARKIDPDITASRAAFKGHPYIAQHAWLTNGAGYNFHNWYGFGAISVDAALDLAASHVPMSLGTFTESDWFDDAPAMDESLTIPDADGAGITRSVAISGLPETANIEAVVLEISAEHIYPIELGVTLTSPSGMPSVVNAPFNAVFEGFRDLQSWQLMSNAFYGESPNGDWTLNVVDLVAEDTGEVTSWRLKFYYGEHGDGAAKP